MCMCAQEKHNLLKSSGAVHAEQYVLWNIWLDAGVDVSEEIDFKT